MEIEETGPPSQSRSQRLRALEKANRVRTQRAEVKQSLRRGETKIVELLVTPPECMLTASVPEVLLAVPGFGKVRVNRLLTRCQISPSKRLGGLSERQRNELVAALGTLGLEDFLEQPHRPS